MLPYLRPDSSVPVDIQNTSFGTDVIGRFVSNSIDEVLSAGGRPFDVVVIGAGMFGAYAAEKIYRYGADQNLRILVLDAGGMLFTTHVQNLPHIGLNPPGTALVTNNTQDPGARNAVWGSPWHSNESFTGLAYCIGGRSVFWGGWSPRLTANDLARWPALARAQLLATYHDVEKEIGVEPAADYLSGVLNTKLRDKLGSVIASVAVPSTSIDEVSKAPLAVQASAPGSGLFSFDKFSSVTLLVDAVRDDIARRWTLNDNSRRRLMLVPRTHVIRLTEAGGRADALEYSSNGSRGWLAAGRELASDCRIVIANGTIESTRLALESFPLSRGSYPMGANFMAHLRTNLIVRVKRSALGLSAATALEQGGAIVRGEITNADSTKRRYHIQVLASAGPASNPESTMWSIVPDIELYRDLVGAQSADWVTIVLRGIGEMDGDPQARPGSVTSFITLTNGADPGQIDEFGARRAWVNYNATAADTAAWHALAALGVGIAGKLAPASDIQYLVGGQWSNQPPADPFAATKDALGNTHHEAGSLWMGDDAATSITASDGRLHHVGNVYVAGPALFPAIGSANPSLTGLSLARQTAQSLADSLAPTQAQTLRYLYSGSLANWQLAGSGSFLQVFDVLETAGGPGILWYTRETFGDFLLELDWQYADRTDNSGVFIRFPSLNGSSTGDPDLAVARGYEIQIDPRGYNSELNTENDPLRSTGAIYSLRAPTRFDVALGPWQWNSFAIEAIGGRIKVTLNGVLINDFSDAKPRSLRGHIGLQNHHPGSKVQFRNIRITPLVAAAAAAAHRTNGGPRVNAPPA